MRNLITQNIFKTSNGTGKSFLINNVENIISGISNG